MQKLVKDTIQKKGLKKKKIDKYLTLFIIDIDELNKH